VSILLLPDDSEANRLENHAEGKNRTQKGEKEANGAFSNLRIRRSGLSGKIKTPDISIEGRKLRAINNSHNDYTTNIGRLQGGKNR